MSHLTNKEVVERFFIEVYNHQDYQASYKYFVPNYLDHTIPHVRTIEDAIEIFKSTHKSFPDIQVTIDDLIEENDIVVFRGHFKATHTGEFVGIAASEKKVEFEALEIFKVENQKITESWGYWPLWEIMSQLQASES